MGRILYLVIDSCILFRILLLEREAKTHASKGTLGVKVFPPKFYSLCMCLSQGNSPQLLSCTKRTVNDRGNMDD